MITAISTAIMSHYNNVGGTALRAVLTGGLYFSEAKPDVSFPYAVFVWEGSTIEEICGGQQNRIETAEISVSIFSKNDDGGTELFDIEDKFLRHFDFAKLIYPAGSYRHIHFARIGIVNHGKVDNIWELELNYEAMFEH